jgi:hypothetical protein
MQPVLKPITPTTPFKNVFSGIYMIILLGIIVCCIGCTVPNGDSIVPNPPASSVGLDVVFTNQPYTEDGNIRTLINSFNSYFETPVDIMISGTVTSYPTYYYKYMYDSAPMDAWGDIRHYGCFWMQDSQAGLMVLTKNMIDANVWPGDRIDMHVTLARKSYDVPIVLEWEIVTNHGRITPNGTLNPVSYQVMTDQMVSDLATELAKPFWDTSKDLTIFINKVFRITGFVTAVASSDDTFALNTIREVDGTSWKLLLDYDTGRIQLPMELGTQVIFTGPGYISYSDIGFIYYSADQLQIIKPVFPKIPSFTATSDASGISLSWSNPTGLNIVIMRNESTERIPTSPADGMRIYQGTGAAHTDTLAVAGIAYTYAAFVLEPDPDIPGDVDPDNISYQVSPASYAYAKR